MKQREQQKQKEKKYNKAKGYIKKYSEERHQYILIFVRGTIIQNLEITNNYFV